MRKKVLSRVQKVSELSENVRTLRCAVSSLVLTQRRSTKAALGCNRLERFRGGVAARKLEVPKEDEMPRGRRKRTREPIHIAEFLNSLVTDQEA